MDTQAFLRRVLGDEGYYCIFAVKGKSRKQKFYGSLPQAHEAAQQFDANGYDTYYALATFEADNSREAINAAQMRAFFFDLDCGPDDPKKFPDQLTAIKELKQFCKVTGLPTPMLVNSGRGVHVYWPLTRPVAPEAWRMAADRLKALCTAHQFKADAAVTADVARVLRVPGTHNYKDNPPREVQLLGSGTVQPVEFEKFVALLPSSAKSISVSDKLKNTLHDPLMQRLLGNKSSNFKNIMKRSLQGNGCAQLTEAYANQATIDEPLWRAALSIAKHCEDADTAIHKMSNKHPQYNHDETVDKAARIAGPYTCDSFNDYNPGACDGCQFRGKIKSPIVLGNYVLRAEDAVPPAPDEVESSEINGTDTLSHVNGHSTSSYTVPPYPGVYFRPLNGGVAVARPTDDPDEGPEEIIIYHNDLYVIRRVRDPDSGENLVWRLHLPKDGVQEFMVPLASVTSREEFRKALSTEGVAVYGKQLDRLMDYAQTWVNALQEEEEADTAKRQFGWSNYDNHESFILGDKEVFRDRIEYSPMSVSTASLLNAFKQRGTLGGWIDTMKFYNRSNMDLHKFVIGLSAGAPLMAFTPLHGALLNLLSQGSGYGKTTTCLAGLSIWGDPDILIAHETDTMNSRMSRAEIMCNLPVVWDEITNIEPKEASKAVYQIANGKQRNRMQGGNNRERWRGLPWHAPFISSSNASVLDKLSAIKMSADGEAHRIMEYHLQKVVFKTKAETDEFAYEVMRNFGHVGVPLLQLYMKDTDAARATLVTVQNEIDLACDLKAEDRFYSAFAAVGVMGVRALNRIGVVDWDATEVQRWVERDFIPTCMRNIKAMEQSLSQILNEYLTVDNHNAVLRIKSTATVKPGTTGNAGLDMLVHVPDKQPGFRMVARYETDTEKLYLIPQPFKKWCSERQISYQSVTKELQEKYGATLKRIRLNRGTRFNMPPADAWEVNLNIDKELR